MRTRPSRPQGPVRSEQWPAGRDGDGWPQRLLSCYPVSGLPSGPVTRARVAAASCWMAGGQGDVPEGGGVGLAGVGEPAERRPGPGRRLAGLAGGDQDPAVAADGVGGWAGLVDDGEAVGGDGGAGGGVGGDGLAGGHDVVAGLVGDGGGAQGRCRGVGALDVADGVGDAADRGGDAGVAVGGVAGGPFEAAAGADLGGPGGADVGEVVAEDVGGAAAVGAVHDGDVGVGQVGAGVEGGDGRVVPLVIWPRKISARTGPVSLSGAPLRVGTL